jgi:predicted phage terminase large subunit-like protein
MTTLDITDAQINFLTRAKGSQSPRNKAYAEWRWKWMQTARDKQITPGGDWSKCLILAGRGWGKTAVLSHWAAEEALATPKTIVHVICPTWADVLGTFFEGPAGCLSHLPQTLIREWSVSDAILEFDNGSILRGFSAEKPDRLRGPQAHRLACDEIAAWQYPQETFDMAVFGLRLGDHVKAMITTTPRPLPIITDLIKEGQKPDSKTVVIRGTTFENRANLAANFFAELITKYDGTTLGRQELYAEIIDPEEQGIIKRSWIKVWPTSRKLPSFRFIVLSLDTAFTEATRDKKSGERDPTAGTVWGVFDHPDEPGRDCMMLLDAWQDYLGMPELVSRVPEEMSATYGEQQEPAIKSIWGRPSVAIAGGKKPDLLLIEDKGSGISLRQMLRKEKIEAAAYNPGNASKLQRLHAVAHFFSNGIIYAPESKERSGQPASWADEAILQLCTFTGEGSIKHDDFVDSATQAIRFLTDKQWITLQPKPPRDDAVDAYNPRRANPYKT